MRFAFLLTGLSGYFASCLQALAARDDVEVLALTPGFPADVAFRPEHVTPRDVTLHTYPVVPSGEEVLRIVGNFAPDVLLVVGWQVRAYRHVARRLRPRPLRVLCMDNQWLRTPKQVAGVGAAPVYLQPLFDAVFLPGERQAEFARRLGFRPGQIWRGLYACQHELFSTAYEQRTASPDTVPRDSFLFVGRLVASKGVDVLAQAYGRYRAAVPRPWPLVVCGAGPLGSHLAGQPGVQLRGFLQPPELPALLAASGCLVLPSRFEPWGVVVQEAAASGVPVICSTACGSSPHLLEDGYNGFLVEPGDVGSLTRAMVLFSELSRPQREAMSTAARHLSFRYTPQRWADTVLGRSTEALRPQSLAEHG